MMKRDKLLIVRAGALGDTLMLLPSINAFKKDYEIIILGKNPGISYLEPFADQCIDMERGGWHRLFSRGADISTFSLQADHVIAFIYDDEKIVSDNLSRLFPDKKVDIFPPFPDPDSKIHVALYMACSIRSTGIPFDYKASFDAAFTKPLIHSNTGKEKKILLHPGSGSKKKNYPPEFWFELLNLIKMERALKYTDIFFMLGPAEENLVSVIEEKAKGFNAGIYLFPEKEELLSILSSTYLYIGHDSGVTHLAAMLGVNTIALFKDSSIIQWHPIGPSVKIIGPDRNAERILKKTIREAVSLF